MQTESNVIAAYFDNHGAAERAIDELRASGFRSDQIGCSYSDASFANSTDVTSGVGQNPHRSFWSKVEGFFKGEEGYEDRNTGVEDGRSNEGLRVGPTLQIPERYNKRLSEGVLVTVNSGSRIAEAEQILLSHGGEIDRDFNTSTSETATRAGTVSGEQHIRLISEVLRVNKQRVQAGEVRLRKETRTEQQNIEVPVTHEELVIERVQTEGRTPASGEIGSDREIRVPLSEERVTVEKQPVVREEVKVGKRTVQDTKRVTDNVRHEELKVDEEGRVKEDKPSKKRIA